MITVTYNGESYECDRAVKGTDYIHLLNSDGTEVATFDGCASFSGFTISGGTYEDATDHSNCKVAAMDCEGRPFRTDKCIDDLATSNNPVFTGSVSQNRKAGTTVGDYSHAEGQNTTASGTASHSDGFESTASGDYSYSDGIYTTASGNYSHAEGDGTKAIGNGSHAEGKDTIAKGTYQHVEGKYNVQDSNETYAHIVGGGTDADHRKNIYTLDWDGNAEFDGDVTDGDGNTLSQLHTDLTTHTGSTSNPHAVTKAQVGLGNVDNTSDLNKPISTATQTALDTINTDLTTLQDDVVGGNAINLLNNTATSQTISGVTFTVNSIDKTVTVNGTSSEFVEYVIGSAAMKSGKAYVYHGCANGGSASTYKLSLRNLPSSDDCGDGAFYTASSDAIATFAICLESGVTANNLVFKPIVEDGSTKHDYVPYIGGSVINAVASLNENLTTLKTYSTTEQVVGEWIDGKPLYRKVINLSDTSIDSTANVVLATLENVDNIISLNGTYAKSNNGTILTYDNFGSVSATKINDVMMYYAFVLSYMNTELYPNSITMRAYDINGGGSYTLTLTRIIIVVEYTKTTDY